MRALVCREFGSFEKLVVEDRDEPVPGDGEIVFEVKAAGLNFADILGIAGQYQVKETPPFVAGNEAAGIVTAVGDGVTAFHPGDRIIGALRGGAFAEKSLVPEDAALPLPEGLDFFQGAAFTVAYGTSYHALKQSARLQPGETVLVLGAAGGVGYAAVDLAKAMGARVIAAASSDEKLDFARGAGADETINYSTTPLRDAVKELTGGNGVDVVYDPVGGELSEQAYRALAWHGRLLVVGFAGGDIPQFPANIALLKEASIVGVWYGTWCARHPDQMRANAMELNSMISAGNLRLAEPQAFRLEDFVEAFRTISERRALGKRIVRSGRGRHGPGTVRVARRNEQL
jgi:NADPH2:quinone reductase